MRWSTRTSTTPKPGRCAWTSVTIDATATLVAVVRDEGSWREPTPDPLHLRGRGIPLMRALTSHAIISSDGDGTCVELRWSGLTLKA